MTTTSMQRIFIIFIITNGILLTSLSVNNQAFALPFGIPESTDNTTNNSSTSETISNNTVSSNFLTYTNDGLGLKIQYPDDWNVMEIGNSLTKDQRAYNKRRRRRTTNYY